MTETLDGEAGAARPAAARRDPAHRRNQWLFGIGTTGRDMVYTLIAFWLIYYLTEVLTLDNATLGALTALILGIRILDAVLDPIAGSIVDGTRSRWGQFKPWLLASSFVAAFFTILLFTDTQLTGWQFVVVFCLVNLLWGVGWAVNDISYWGMLPALSLDKRDREQTGSIAKVFSTVGLFVVAAGALPFVNALQDNGITETTSWMWLAVACSTLMVLSILVTVLGVRERRDIDTSGERVSLREIWRVLAGNDQLVWAAVAYGLFMFGNGLVGTFGPYFFKYVYGDGSVFDTFVIFVGLGQLAGYAVFPLLSARMPRARLYAFVTALMVAGLVGFFFLPMDILLLGAAAVFLFFLASVVMLLMLVFQADTIEYGQLKLGQRNGAVTFALQPFINKVSGALNTAVVGLVAIVSGINDAATPADVTEGGRLLVRTTMLLVPAVLVAFAYVVWRRKFVIDEAAHARIVAELDERGALRVEGVSP